MSDIFEREVVYQLGCLAEKLSKQTYENYAHPETMARSGAEKIVWAIETLIDNEWKLLDDE